MKILLDCINYYRPSEVKRIARSKLAYLIKNKTYLEVNELVFRIKKLIPGEMVYFLSKEI